MGACLRASIFQPMHECRIKEGGACVKDVVATLLPSQGRMLATCLSARGVGSCGVRTGARGGWARGGLLVWAALSSVSATFRASSLCSWSQAACLCGCFPSDSSIARSHMACLVAADFSPAASTRCSVAPALTVPAGALSSQRHNATGSEHGGTAGEGADSVERKVSQEEPSRVREEFSWEPPRARKESSFRAREELPSSWV